MKATDDGLKSEPLRAALASAVKGDARKLEDLLCRHGGGADIRPNLRLAAAVGVEIASLPIKPVQLLTRFGADDAAPDDPRVFFPVVAAHAWAALLRHDPAQQLAWTALAELAADERGPVRVGTLDALVAFASGSEGAGTGATAGVATSAVELVSHAIDWLSSDDRDKRFSTAALVIEVLRERRIVARLAGESALLDYLSRAVDEVGLAPQVG